MKEAPVAAVLLLLLLAPGARAQMPQADALQTILDARAAVARKDWPRAMAILPALVAQSPGNGAFVLMLADTRLATGAYDAAIGAYTRALALGAADPATLNYRIAKCHALMGNGAAALASLGSAMALGYRDLEQARQDPAFAFLRNDPRYRTLLGIVVPSRMTRDEGWRYDIKFLADWVEKKAYHPFRTTTGDRAVSGARMSRREFEDAVAKLNADVPHLDDSAIEVALIRLVAQLGDGHTEMAGAVIRGQTSLSLPLSFYIFDDGVHVIAAAPRYKSLLGAKVAAVDGMPIQEVLRKLDGLIARDNSMWVTTQEPLALRRAGLLHALGISRTPDAVTLSLQSSQGTREVRVVADATEPNIWNMLPRPPGWVWIGDGSRADFQRGNNVPFWMHWDAQSRILYVQYNNVFNAPNQTLADFAKTLGATIAARSVAKLVIDMRNNNGGNTYLNEPMLRVVENSQKVNRPGHLYVIIGRRTFSAAMNAVSYFGKYTDAIFVGEPTGGKPNAPGDETFFTLPYSGISVNLSDRYWQGSWPDDFSTWRAPDIAVPVRFPDYVAGHDAAMAAIEAQPLPP